MNPTYSAQVLGVARPPFVIFIIAKLGRKRSLKKNNMCSTQPKVRIDLLHYPIGTSHHIVRERLGCSITETKRIGHLGSMLRFSEAGWIPRAIVYEMGGFFFRSENSIGFLLAPKNRVQWTFGGIYTFQSNPSMIYGDLWTTLGFWLHFFLDKQLVITIEHISRIYICLPAYT